VRLDADPYPPPRRLNTSVCCRPRERATRGTQCRARIATVVFLHTSSRVLRPTRGHRGALALRGFIRVDVDGAAMALPVMVCAILPLLAESAVVDVKSIVLLGLVNRRSGVCMRARSNRAHAWRSMDGQPSNQSYHNSSAYEQTPHTGGQKTQRARGAAQRERSTNRRTDYRA